MNHRRNSSWNLRWKFWRKPGISKELLSRIFQKVFFGILLFWNFFWNSFWDSLKNSFLDTSRTFICDSTRISFWDSSRSFLLGFITRFSWEFRNTSIVSVINPGAPSEIHPVHFFVIPPAVSPEISHGVSFQYFRLRFHQEFLLRLLPRFLQEFLPKFFQEFKKIPPGAHLRFIHENSFCDYPQEIFRDC